MNLVLNDRKIGRKGLNSLDLILPAIWVKSLKLKAGDELRIEILNSGELLIGVNKS